jgi:predicted PurR-regulated permease PerM
MAMDIGRATRETVGSRSPETTAFADAQFVWRVFIVTLFAALVAAIYMLSDVLLPIFAAVLLSIALRTIAAPFTRLSGIGEPWNVLAAALLIVLVLGGAGWAYGGQLGAQIQYLATALPSLLKTFAEDLKPWLGGNVFDGSSLGSLIARAVSWGTSIFGALASLVLVVFGAIYIAVNPATYKQGFIKVMPPPWHGHIEETLRDADVALARWLGSQLIAMASVGTLTGIGLWLVGVPSPLALGLIAGLADFVPYLGPTLGAVPALFLAGAQGFDTLLATIAVIVVVQQVENNIIMPMVARHALSVPPATAVFAVVAMGVLFGPLGLLLGFPLTVVADVVIRRLYVRETLGEPVEIAAEEKRKQG